MSKITQAREPNGGIPADAPERPFDPGGTLFPYQRRWADDPSRFKFGLMARQVGKDFAAGFEAIRHCYAADQKKQKVDWLIVAPSERQSLESLRKWKDWAESFKVPIASCDEERDGGSQSLLRSATITFPHGSRVIAVPGKPDTVRGYSANVLLTEFAFFEDADATWRAVFPSISNSMRGGLKKIRLITTPNGVNNKAYDLWSKNFSPPFPSPLDPNSNPDPPKSGRPDASGQLIPTPTPLMWSCHFVDIHTAVKDGLFLNIDEVKAALDDPECWAQEYECRFLDAQSILLSYELIANCESQDAPALAPPDFWQSSHPNPLVIGIDFGRRRDLSVAWSLARQGDVQQTVEVLEMDKLSTPEQVERLRPRLHRAQRACLDYTGAGVGLGDYLVKEFGEWNPNQHKHGKIELCTFTNPLKVEIFSKMRMAFERRSLRIPVSRAIREDLRSINRVTTATGQITYRAAHSPDGHADRSTALALALRAASTGATKVEWSRPIIREDLRHLRSLGQAPSKVYL